MADTAVCRLDGCETEFEKKVHNQSFCGKEHCRIYTNARILAAYHSKKNKITTGRVCRSKDCNTLLSQYNPEDICSLCQQKQQVKKLEDWGWSIDQEGFRVAV